MNQDDNAPAAPPPGAEGVEPQKLTVPFEDESKDFFTGLIETIKLILFKPSYFFRNYNFDGAIGKPLLFAVMIGWTMSVVNAMWLNITKTSVISILSNRILVRFQEFAQEHMPEAEGIDWDQMSGGGTSSDFIWTLIFAPLGIMLGIFFMAGIYHLFLLIVKGANRRFETTFNVVAYGAVSHLANIVPFVGDIISIIYAMVLGIIGLSGGHNTERWKATTAVFGPYVLCLVCCTLPVLLFIVPRLGG